MFLYLLPDTNSHAFGFLRQVLKHRGSNFALSGQFFHDLSNCKSRLGLMHPSGSSHHTEQLLLLATVTIELLQGNWKFKNWRYKIRDQIKKQIGREENDCSIRFWSHIQILPRDMAYFGRKSIDRLWDYWEIKSLNVLEKHERI